MVKNTLPTYRSIYQYVNLYSAEINKDVNQYECRAAVIGLYMYEDRSIESTVIIKNEYCKINCICTSFPYNGDVISVQCAVRLLDRVLVFRPSEILKLI